MKKSYTCYLADYTTARYLLLIGLCLIRCCGCRNSLKIEKICPKYPSIPTVKCPHIKPVKFNICTKNNSSAPFICIDKKNAQNLLYNIKILKKCIRAINNNSGNIQL